MAPRYEWSAATATDVKIVAPHDPEFHDDADAPEADDWAIVLGNPYATAFVVSGDLEELEQFAARVLALVQHAKGAPRG